MKVITFTIDIGELVHFVFAIIIFSTNGVPYLREIYADPLD